MLCIAQKTMMKWSPKPTETKLVQELLLIGQKTKSVSVVTKKLSALNFLSPYLHNISTNLDFCLYNSTKKWVST